MQSIKQAISAFRQGKFVVVVDNEDRENEGDLIIAAQKITPEAITFMAKQASGLICLALTPEQIDKLELPMMVETSNNTDKYKTAFTVSIDAANHITTGISAADRAYTTLIASNPTAIAGQLTTPGHLFPLRSHPEGILKRPGHTEAAVTLAQLSGLWPAGVICEIMKEDGTMMRYPQLIDFAKQHQLPLITIEQLIDYCQQTIRESEFDEAV